MGKFRKQLLPPASTFYKSELKLSRPSRGWARSACPFHSGTNPSAFAVNLVTGGYCCHNCGIRGGDLVDFVRQRDRCDFVTAAKSLGAWDADGVESDLVRLEREAKRRARQEKHDRYRDQLEQLLDQIETYEAVNNLAVAVGHGPLSRTALNGMFFVGVRYLNLKLEGEK